MRNLLTVIVLGVGASVCALAQVQSPEIDPGSGASALTLLAGAILVIRSRTRR